MGKKAESVKIKSKEERIKEEKQRLAEFYADMEPAKKGIAAGLIERAAFMRVQCEDLERYLNENGWTEPFSQGNQEPYDRARPQGQTYNTLNANYQKIIKQLDTMLPPADKPEQDADGFDEFAARRG
jgi:hypothetical protein